MDTLTQESATTHDTNQNDELFHWTCCDDNRALCGADVTDVPETEGVNESHCVVCEDLVDDEQCREGCEGL